MTFFANLVKNIDSLFFFLGGGGGFKKKKKTKEKDPQSLIPQYVHVLKDGRDNSKTKSI
jgi:hypothetical protein